MVVDDAVADAAGEQNPVITASSNARAIDYRLRISKDAPFAKRRAAIRKHHKEERKKRAAQHLKDWPGGAIHDSDDAPQVPDGLTDDDLRRFDILLDTIIQTETEICELLGELSREAPFYPGAVNRSRAQTLKRFIAKELVSRAAGDFGASVEDVRKAQAILSAEPAIAARVHSGELTLDEAMKLIDGDVPDTETTTTPTCPNCGHAEFDEDGDCAKCREPGVVKTEEASAENNERE